MKVGIDKNSIVASLQVGAILAGVHTGDAAPSSNRLSFSMDSNVSAIAEVAIPPKLEKDWAPNEIEFTIPEHEWTPKHEKRFEFLAIQEALDEITPEEQGELEKLSALRRETQSPRSGEEVMWEYKQMQITHQLLDSLRKYVQFHECPRPARRSSQG